MLPEHSHWNNPPISQVLLVSTQGPVPVQSDQDQADHTGAVAEAGQEAVRVPLRCSGLDSVISPVCNKAGQLTLRVAVRVSVWVWVLGLGSTHWVAQVLETTVQEPVPAQDDHADQEPHTGDPVGDGQVAVRVRVRSSGLDSRISPTWPAGQFRVRFPVRVSLWLWVLGLGNTHSSAQVFTEFLVLPVRSQELQEPKETLGRVSVPYGQL